MSDDVLDQEEYAFLAAPTAELTSALFAIESEVNFLFVAGFITLIFFEDFDFTQDPLINK